MRRHAIGACLTLVMAAAPFAQGTGPQGAPSEAATRIMVTVEANSPWVDSGVTVRKGERLSFAAEGSIRWGSKPEQVAGPDGHTTKPGKLGAGGLIGRVGYNGKPFPIGSTRTPIAMPASGKLFLGINDFIFGDNAGSFVVTIADKPT